MLLMAAEQTINDVKNRPISCHFDYPGAREGEKPVFSPAPPHLDYEAPRPEGHAAALAMLRQPWLKRNDMDTLCGFAYETGARPVIESLKVQRHRHAQQMRMQVEALLKAEISFRYDQHNRLLDDRRQGRKPGKRTPAGTKRKAEEPEARLERHENELAQEDMIHARPAVVRGMALVISDHALHPETQQTEEAGMHAWQTEEVDRRAVALTMAAERALGRHPTEMPHNTRGAASIRGTTCATGSSSRSRAASICRAPTPSSSPPTKWPPASHRRGGKPRAFVDDETATAQQWRRVRQRMRFP